VVTKRPARHLCKYLAGSLSDRSADFPRVKSVVQIPVVVTTVNPAQPLTDVPYSAAGPVCTAWTCEDEAVYA